MDLQLTDKTALVTGSTAGIGFAIAKALAKEGAKVIVNGRSQERVDAAIDGIRAEDNAAKLVAFVGDISNAAGARATIEQFPHVDILVNNLGIFKPAAFAEATDALWAEHIETNFMSGVRLSRHYLPAMIGAGWGRIIFISSESAVNIPAEMIHYGVTKTMQISLARGMAEMTAGTAVTVNTVLPGPTRSEGVENYLVDLSKHEGKSLEQVEKDFFLKTRPSSLLQRFASCDEVAHLVAYVASPLAAATNGAALRVEGGLLRGIL